MIKIAFNKKDSRSLLSKTLMLLSCFFIASVINVNAQTNSISGIVKDEFSEPLIGVSVHLDGTTKGTLTDVNGKYTVGAQKGDVLVFSFVGMKTQRVTIANQTSIDIVMGEDAHLLTETVVIGYGTAKKRDLTGSIVSVSAEQIANRPSSNPLASLQGRISGVQVINSGQAGQDPEIKIRGTNSINGYKPLYVVDGLFNDNINFINPADIESMEILKDPSSLAIFGVRGANGVIIVTTKKAKQGQTVVNLNTSFGFKKVVNRMKLTNAAQFKEMYNEQMVNEAVGTGEAPAIFDFSGWTANTDWQDEIFQTGFITDNNVSISSAGEKNRFYLGVGYAQEEGSIKHEKFGKVTINLSSEYEVFKDAKVGFQFNGARMTPADSKEVLNALRAAPVYSPFNPNAYDTETGTYGMYEKSPSLQQEVGNPMTDVDMKARTNRAVNYRGGGNIYGDVTFLKDFNFRAMFSLDYRSDDSRVYTPRIKLYDRNQALADPTLKEPYHIAGDGKRAIKQEKINETKVQSDYILTYTKALGDHNITGTGGFTTYYNSYSGLETARKEGTTIIPNDPDKWHVGMGDPGSATNASDVWERSTVSLLARGLYNYKNKYLFNASFRRDASSGFFPTGNEWQNFYSFGGGWVATEEAFMKPTASYLDYLKVKASWGVLGNQNMNKPYPANPVIDNTNSAIFGKQEYMYGTSEPEYIADRNLRWEKIEAWEAGFESQFLRNRLHLDFTYYNKETKDLLATVEGISGTTPGLGNLGTMRNRGIELSLGWGDNIGEDWRYGISGNLTTISNKVTHLVQHGYNIISGDKSIAYTMTGYPISMFWGYKVEGVYQSQEDIDNSPKNNVGTVKPGDLKFVDVNGDGVVDTNDRTQIGNPTPDFTYGLSLNVGYKGFDLSVDMMGVYGNEIYRTWDNYNWSRFNYLAARVDRWNGPGTSNSEPILNTKRTINNQNSEYYIEDGSFFRIRNIQLAYTFDQSWLSKIKMKGLKAYINVQNPITWKKNTGYTPEIAPLITEVKDEGTEAVAFGIDKGTYPVPAIYTFGLNITF